MTAWRSQHSIRVRWGLRDHPASARTRSNAALHHCARFQYYSGDMSTILEAAVDLSHPSRSVVPTLDGIVLTVLVRTTRALTVSEIHRLAGTGSENGVRRVLSRLAREGTVRADEHSVATFYEANREHLAWSAIETLANLRRTLFERIREELNIWDPAACHASMFGSAARGDGDADSDIDILLIRPEGVEEEHEAWAAQVDRLRRRVEAWTGNYCQVFQINLDRLAAHVTAGDALVDEWRRDEVTLAGDSLRTVLRQLPPHRGDS